MGGKEGCQEWEGLADWHLVNQSGTWNLLFISEHQEGMGEERK